HTHVHETIPVLSMNARAQTLEFTLLVFFFFNDTATTEIYTLSLHDALPISTSSSRESRRWLPTRSFVWERSEEHTSELQSHHDLVCRLLLEKKHNNISISRGYEVSTRELLMSCIRHGA